MVLLLAPHLPLPRRREHGGPRGARAHSPLALLAQSRAAQRAPLRRRTLRGAHAAPERAPRARAARPAPPAAAAAARAGAVRSHGARHRLRQCLRRHLHDRGARRRLANLAQPDRAYPRAAKPQQFCKAAARRHSLQGGGLDLQRYAGCSIYNNPRGAHFYAQ